MPEAVFSVQPLRTHPTTLSHVPSQSNSLLDKSPWRQQAVSSLQSCALPLLLPAELLLGSEAMPGVLMELCDSWALLVLVGVADVVTSSSSLLVK